MRITNITVTNFQGLRNAALVVSEPLLLVSGHNGAGKSSLLDAISMAFTGQPRRVSLKKEVGQLVTEGAKKGEAHVTYLGDQGEQSAWVMLPGGKTAPLLDEPFLPFVLDAQRFAALDGKERRKALFELTGASANPNEIATRLLDKGAAPALVETIKPILRAGFGAAAEQAKEYASEARGAWKQLTGEAYGSEKAEGWEPAAAPVDGVEQSHIDEAKQRLDALEQDLADANQALGASKAAAKAADRQQQELETVRETASTLQRRRDKLAADQQRLAEWAQKVSDAEQAASSGAAMGCPCCNARLIVDGGVLVKVDGHAPADPDLARRLGEYRGYLESAQRAVANSQRDVAAAEAADVRLAELEAGAASVPPAEAIANAEQTILELRQERDRAAAKHQFLAEAYAASGGRAALIANAAKCHVTVKAWSLIAGALAPDGIPAEILAGALQPVNDKLAELSAAATWRPVQISEDITVTYGGRAYGLLSESEKWRCDALLAIAIAQLSGLRFVALDRFDVLQVTARPQILGLLRKLTQSGALDSAILAGTMKEPMARVPAGIQAVWIESGQIDAPAQLKAAS